MVDARLYLCAGVADTEIDWIAYMQEVKGVMDGQYNYTNLRGDTGPLVYPAGFVWVYSAFYSITSEGTNIRLGQYIFAVLYVMLIAVVSRLYQRSAAVCYHLGQCVCL